MQRDLWTCDALNCHACVAKSDRRHCSLNNQNGLCCTRSDTRPACSETLRNCTSSPGFNTTRNFAYLVCGFNNTACGFNPDPNLATDKELDPRFSGQSNFIISRNTPMTFSTGLDFNTNSRCTYIIK